MPVKQTYLHLALSAIHINTPPNDIERHGKIRRITPLFDVSEEPVCRRDDQIKIDRHTPRASIYLRNTPTPRATLPPANNVCPGSTQTLGESLLSRVSPSSHQTRMGPQLPSRSHPLPLDRSSHVKSRPRRPCTRRNRDWRDWIHLLDCNLVW
jgi:hypothetical protein